MKKIALLSAFIVFVVLGSIYNFQTSGVSEVKSSPVIHLTDQTTAAPFMLSEQKESLPVTDRKFVTTKSKTKSKDEFADYEKTPLTFFNEPYFIVEGLFATHMESSDKKAISKKSGFFVYDSQSEQSYPLIYSPERDAYGYFTGEIIVNGGYAKALEFIQGKSLEIVFKNEVAEQIIFRIDDLNDLSALEGLKSIPHSKIEPDVKFSRLNPI
jgi:hypothetical protein